MEELEELEPRDINKEHDQFCQYPNLPVLLKRFSFQEKMGIATIYSSHVILFGRDMRKSRETKALPWCLETFVMLAMEAYEYADGRFDGKNRNKFVKMHNAILNATSVATDTPCGRFNFIDTFMAATALNQFHMQEFPLIRQYRYWNIFNDDSQPVQLKRVFEKKMGTPYEDFLLLGYILQVLFIAQAQNKAVAIPQKTFHYLLNVRFPEAAKHLRITRAEYVALQHKFVANSKDPYKYVYSLSPSYQYTFVEEAGATYFPLPHLINQNITSSLLYRLTEGNDDLRRQIGLHLWEKYLLQLVSQSGVYQETFPEQLYRYSGSEAHSPDVIARQDNLVLFMDSKSTVPNIGIRLFDPDSYENNIRIVAGNIVQLYKQIHRFALYNPFGGTVSNNMDDYWGIVVVLEDAYIRRVRYFEKAKDDLGIQEESKEWQWLIEHIKVVSLYEVERVCLSGNSLIEACRDSYGDDPFNFTFAGYPPNGSSINNLGFRIFKKSLDDKAMDIITEMRQHGAL